MKTGHVPFGRDECNGYFTRSRAKLGSRDLKSYDGIDLLLRKDRQGVNL